MISKLTPAQRLHQKPYPIIALTGGIASGKSTVAEYAKNKNVPVISADQLIKDIYTWPETQDWLRQHFPGAVVENKVDFSFIRKSVFSDAKKKEELEQYLYARLPRAFDLAEAKYPHINWLIYEVPLLFERGLESQFDKVVVVWVPEQVQRQRLKRRNPDLSVEEIENFLKGQLPIDEKRKRADLIFDNSIERTANELREALDDFWAQLTAK